jgi:hypothetical protein
METLVNERATLVAEVERLRAERQRMENVVLKCSESGTGHDWVNDPEGPSFCRVCNCDTEAIFDAIVAMLARARAALEETKP